MKVKAAATLCTNGREGKMGILGLGGGGVRSARVALREGGYACTALSEELLFPDFFQKQRHSKASSFIYLEPAFASDG
jgi:hypothetical protein